MPVLRLLPTPRARAEKGWLLLAGGAFLVGGGALMWTLAPARPARTRRLLEGPADPEEATLVEDGLPPSLPRVARVRTGLVRVPTVLDRADVRLPEGVTDNPNTLWTPEALAFITRLRARVSPSIPLHVDSVVRTPKRQAAAMLRLHDEAEAREVGGGAREIRRWYGAKAERFLAVPRTLDAWTACVEDLRATGQGFRDGHLGGNALDLRLAGLSAAASDAVARGVAEAGGRGTRKTLPSAHLHVDLA